MRSSSLSELSLNLITTSSLSNPVLSLEALMKSNPSVFQVCDSIEKATFFPTAPRIR